MSVLILMATCNGAGFLPEQVASIQAQTHADWHLLARDDASDDTTAQLLHGYSSRDPRIEILDDGHGRLGVQRNFGRLLEEAATRGADRIALADQDDHWRPDKLERQLSAMDALERDTGAEQPCLVFSDLEVVDEAMRPLHASFMRYQGIRHPQDAPLLSCLFRNQVVGVTLMANRALLSVALPLPDGIQMHDWWLSLCAHAAGNSAYLPLPLVRYRQHAANHVGATGIARMLTRPRRALARLCKMNCLYRLAYYQAGQLGERLRREALSTTELDGLLALRGRSRPARLVYLLRQRFHAQHPAVTLLVLAQCLYLSTEGHVQGDAFRHGCRERAQTGPAS
jgi:hypothetical protein